MKTEVFVAAHKKNDLVLPEGYRLIQVNSSCANEIWTGCLHDNEGDNISIKNNSYCELTALYWAWKNSDADIKGLCHYRRFFDNIDKLNSISFFPDIYEWTIPAYVSKEVLTLENINKALSEYDIIVSFPFRPYPTDAYSDLLRYCFQKDIDVLSNVILRDFPDYYETYINILKSKHLSYCNMMISKKEIFDNYCFWLFDVLTKVESKCDIEKYDVHHKRLFGYFAEVLMNVYIEKNSLRKKYYKILRVSDDNAKNRMKLSIKGFLTSTPSLKVISNPSNFIWNKRKRDKLSVYRECEDYIRLQTENDALLSTKEIS